MSTPATQTKYYYGFGKRKAASARAKIYPGTEFAIKINGKLAQEYFPQFYYLTLQNMIQTVGFKQGAVEIFVNGGGVMAQSEASRLAIAHALVSMDEGFRPVTRLYGYISTDIRKVLPKRPGRRKARKSEQWSKR